MTVLREILLDSRDGEWGKGEPFDGGHWSSVIRGTDFAGARTCEVSNVPKRVLEERHLRRKVLAPSDIVIETAGGTKDQPTGRTLYVTERLLNALPHSAVCASFARFLRIDPDKADPGYIFWLLQDHYQRRELLRFHTQHTGVARFQFTTFADTYEFQLPRPEVQRCVADVLFAYDNLIEVNQRRITILKDIVRRLFNEWFVHFRYPGHEATPLVETEFGMAPKTWLIESVADVVARRKAGNVYKANDVVNRGSVIVIDQSTDEYLGFHNNKPDHLASPEAPLMIFGDHTCKLRMLTRPFSVGPNTVVFGASKQLPASYLFGLIQDAVSTHEYKRHWSDLSKKRFPIAPVELAQQYSELVRPMFQQCDTLYKVNRNLAIQRDLLLPKLISGEIDISRSENTFAEAAE